MTDDDKALVERLRYDCDLAQQLGDEARVVLPATDVRTMADRIEAQAAEIYGLRKALGWFVNDVRFTVQVGGNPLTVPGMIDAATKIYFGPDQKIYCGEDDD